jgi:hypothetical protein
LAKRIALSSWLSSRLSDSGVVSSMCGGRTRWRVLRSEGVSPVRVSTRMSRPISSIGVKRLRCTSTGQRLEWRDVEGVEAVGRRFDQLDEARKEAGESLARSGRRDEKRAPPGRGGGEPLALVPPQRPAFRETIATTGGRSAVRLQPSDVRSLYACRRCGISSL